jgi:hypothetical protein
VLAASLLANEQQTKDRPISGRHPCSSWALRTSPQVQLPRAQFSQSLMLEGRRHRPAWRSSISRMTLDWRSNVRVFFSLNEVKRVVARYYSSLLAHDTLLLLLEALKYMLVRLRRPTGPKCRYLFGEVYYRNGEACLSPAHAVARCWLFRPIAGNARLCVQCMQSQHCSSFSSYRFFSNSTNTNNYWRACFTRLVPCSR